jgi:hypothetical protein
MYVAESTSKYGEMNPSPIDHICLFFDYISGTYDIDLLVDVVNRSGLEKLIGDIASDIDVLRQASETEIGIGHRKNMADAFRKYHKTQITKQFSHKPLQNNRTEN